MSTLIIVRPQTRLRMITSLHKSIDVRITHLVSSADYKVQPANIDRPGDSRALAASYNHKAGKHGPTSVPLIFDMAGRLHSCSRKFLSAAAGKEGATALSFFRKTCTAAICRMIGFTYRRSIANRMRSDPPAHDQRLIEEMTIQTAEYAEIE